MSNNLENIINIASREGNLDVIKFLVDKGADVNSKDKDGYAPLNRAALAGHLDIVKYLVNKGGADVNAKDEDGNTPLYYAAGKGHLDIVKFLVNKGADVNSQNIDEYTPLIDAAREGHIKVVNFLANRGADINAKNKHGHTAIYYAKNKGNTEIVKSLLYKLKHVNNKNLICLYEEEDDYNKKAYKVINYIDDNEKNINEIDEYGNTILHHASYVGDTSLVKELLLRKADITIKNKIEETALCIAAKEEFIEIVKIIEDHYINLLNTNQE